eukprot:TRINITY_DN4064_c0_g1_i1.p1 TRINITY_DN4064_c0_g1~~TRINITY_DN4064_c0_g1_i1.p1  ORF type:complete len:293 (-),score=61.48 TRINITY_DN4064_c0_g1_i1:349-1227(-)
MPIARGSSMMSLGTWKARSTKYQRFLNLSNVFMLIVSTILLFTSGILISFYHLTKLDFWSWYFYACPMCMLALGLYTFAVSVYGFLISNQESRGLISLIAIFLSIAFFVQIFSVFTAFELRNKINMQRIPPNYLENMREYNRDDSITSNWDTMQRELRCCGGMHFEDGFNEWNTIMAGDVPDSCCHEETEGCGKGKITYSQEGPFRTDLSIWKDGCLEILQLKMRDDVAPLLIVYSGVGVLLAIVELITVVLACSYIAQISRRRRRDEMFTRAATANDEEYLSSLTNKETNF